MQAFAKFSDKALHWLFLALFFCTPLIMWTRTSEVFEFNKMLFVYAITILVAFFWLSSSFIRGKIIIKRSALDLPILVFLLSQVISTVNSIDVHTSLWGYYSRFHGGLMSTLSYLTLYYAFTSTFEIKKNLNLLVNTILASATIVAIYGVLEHFGIDKHVWVQDVQNRVFSTMGQPNWLSAFFVALLPLPIFLALKSKQKLNFFIYSSLACLFLITTLFTKSQSGIGALFIELFLILSVELFFLFKKYSQKKSPHFPLLVSFFVVIIFFIGTPWTPNPNQLQKSLDLGGPLLPSFEKYLNKLHLTSQIKPFQVQKLNRDQQVQYDLETKGVRFGGSNSMEIRQVVWKGAIEIGKRHPLFGTGLETFAYTYFGVRPIEHNLLSEWDFLYNKAHNEYLNFLANSGFVGLGSLLILIFVSLFTFLKNAIEDHENSHLHLALLFGYISILITNYFGFSVVSIALFFFLFPAISLEIRHQSKALTIPLPEDFAAIVISILLIISLASLSNTYKYWQADQRYNSGRNGLMYGGEYLSDSITSLTDAVKSSPDEPLYLSQLSEAQAQAAVYLNEQLKTLTASQDGELMKRYQAGVNQFRETALQAATQAVSMNPHHVNYQKSLAKNYLFLASIDPNYHQKAIDTLLGMTKIAPTDAKLYFNAGLIYYNQKKFAEAKPLLEKALSLKPDYNDATHYLYLLSLETNKK